jgi:hypothetical protein
MEKLAPQMPRRPRFGCLGCLGRVFAALVLGVVLLFAITAVFAPWGYYLGGHFRPWPVWQGWGTIHAAPGDYVVFMEMFPTSSGIHTTLSGPSVKGSGMLCSPHGEKYNLRLSGGFSKKGIGIQTDGQPFSISLSEPLNFLAANRDTRLSVGFHGAWKNPDLVLDDRGSIARYFNPDGTLYSGDPRKHPAPGQPLMLTLHEGSRSDFNAACAAAKRP